MRRWLCIFILLFCSCRKTEQERTPESKADLAPPSKILPDDQPQMIHASTGAAPGYVGQDACYSCHADIYKKYQHTGMAKSFFKPSVDNVIENFDGAHFYHEPSDRHYDMSIEDDRFFVTRYQTDGEGQRFNEWRQEITWVIGSGHHSRGYLYQTESGELFQMPVAWYTQTSEWGMAPGYDHAGQDDFSRPITRSCMFCHNAYPEVPVGSDVYGQPDLFPHDLPEGTGCERCHGPGAEHVRVATDLNASMEAIRTSIVNPERLSPTLANDVCMQCHLQPTSKLTSFVRTFGTADYAYRPGQPLPDYMVHFDFETNDDDTERFEIDSAAYRMRQSVCFEKSGGALTCITCHDPHEKVPHEAAADYFRERCFICHAEDACRVDAMSESAGHDAGGDCISCHMPKRRTDDVVHVVMTDHKIVRHRPKRDLLAELAETPSPEIRRTFFYKADRAPTALADVYLLLPEVRDGVLGSAGKLAKRIGANATDDVEPRLELASAALTENDLALAADALGGVEDSADPLPVYHALLGTLKGRSGDWAGAVKSFEHALALSPNYSTVQYNLAAAAMKLGQLEKAEAALIETVRLRPAHAKAHLNLGNVFIRTGRVPGAVEAFERAAAVDPNYVSAYYNAGLARIQLGDEAGAVRVWRRGLLRDVPHQKMAFRLAKLLMTAEDAEMRDAEDALTYAFVSAMHGDDAEMRVVLATAMLLNDRVEDALSIVKPLTKEDDRVEAILIAAIAQKRMGMASSRNLFDRVRDRNGGDRLRTMLLQMAKDEFDGSGSPK